MIDAPGELVAPLPIARGDQEVHAGAARQVRRGEVLNQFLSDRIEAVFGDDIIRERRVAISRISGDFPRLRKVPAQHVLGGDEALQNHARPAPPRFVVAEVEGLILADAPAGVAAELVIRKSGSACGWPEELACLECAVADEVVGYAVERVA